MEPGGHGGVAVRAGLRGEGKGGAAEVGGGGEEVCGGEGGGGEGGGVGAVVRSDMRLGEEGECICGEGWCMIARGSWVWGN